MIYDDEAQYLSEWARYQREGPCEIAHVSEMNVDYLVAACIRDYKEWGEIAVFEFEAEGVGRTLTVPRYNLAFRSNVVPSVTRASALKRLTKARQDQAHAMALEYRSRETGPDVQGSLAPTLHFMEDRIRRGEPMHHRVRHTGLTGFESDVSNICEAARVAYAAKSRTFWGSKQIGDQELEWAAASIYWIDRKEELRKKHQGAVWRKLQLPENEKLMSIGEQLWD